MNRRDFVKHRRADWQAFERLVDRLEGRAASGMGHAKAETFSRLFRLVCSDLATVRSQGWSDELADYLNDLVARGHSVFYTAPPGHLRALVRFLTVGYPRVFRRHIGYFWAGSALFFLPFFVAWFVVWANPDLAARVLPREQLVQMEEMYDHDAEMEGAEFDEGRAGMAGFYVWNNVGIALRAFGSGILLGLPTVYTLLFNGLVLGSVFGYVLAAGHGRAFTSFVISHGSFELTAIAIAGGAGLMLGDAILHRGNRTLFESLQDKGLDAVRIAGGAAAMLVVAALIEAFWSPAPIPSALKYLVGTGLWVLVVLYLALAGRDAVQDEEVET